MKLIKRIKECKVHSLMYILGTALAVCYVMLLVIPLFLSVAPVYPEKRRWNTYTIGHIEAKWAKRCIETDCRAATWYEIFSKVKSVENIAMVSQKQHERVITTDGKHDKELVARYLSPGAFKVYDFEFVEGRPFTWDELEKGEAGVILTVDAARSLFGESEKVVGRMVTIGFGTESIQGVVKSPTRYATYTCADIYCPMESHQQLISTDYCGVENDPYYKDLPYKLYATIFGTNYSAHFVGTPGQAEAVGRELDALVQAFNSQIKASGEEGEIRFSSPPCTALGSRWGDGEQALVRSLIFSAIILFLLLIPVLSLVSLVSWRMTGRIPEIAVRRAFGATRRTLLNEILAENLQLTCVGGLLGLLAAWCYVPNSEWLMNFVGAPIESGSSAAAGHAPIEALMSPWIFLLAFLFCLVINLAAALVPAWRMLRGSYSGVQSADGCRHTMFVPGPFRASELWHSKMELLKVFLIALASWLLVDVAFVMFAERHWPGKFDTGRYAVIRIEVDPTLMSSGLESLEMSPQVMVEEACRLPQVEEATILCADYIPGAINRHIIFAPDTLFDGWTENKRHKAHLCGYATNLHLFETLGVSPVKGSPSIREMEEAAAPNRCILSRSAALHAFGTTEVVGRTLWQLSSWGNEATASYQVTGVVEDVGMNQRQRIKDVVYAPNNNSKVSTRYLLLRLKPGCNVQGFCEQYNRQERSGRIVSNIYSATTAQSLASYCGQQGSYADVGEQLSGVGALFLLLNLLLGMVGTFWIRTRGMRGYIGVMRAFGAGRRRIVVGLLAEGWLITIVAFALATAIALYITGGEPPSGSLSTAGFAPIDWLDIPWQHALVSGAVILVALLFTVGLGIIIPAWMATKEHITESIRQE